MTTKSSSAGETVASAGALGRTLLELRGVRHKWKSAATPVLDDVSLTLAAGEVVWIGGQNGAGKTTLLRIAGGILSPQRGSVTIDGCTPRARGRQYQRRLGYLSAGDRGLYARMTVTQQLDYWARLAYVPRAHRRAAVTSSIVDFGLTEYAQHRVDRLSQGWRQRVRLAMAFLHRPDVLLLDEPRNSLDDLGYAVLHEQIRSAASRGGAVLWCSPRDEDRAINFDRSYTLVSGTLVSAT
jgi:ABC-2 type transport system ATP-binding protein